MARRYELTASEWNRIKDYLPPEEAVRKEDRGKITA